MANLIAVVCFLCGLVAAVPIDERIIGGNGAPDGAFPYVVSLRNFNNKHVATGTIISDSWILSLAQDVEGVAISTVVAGITRLRGNGTTYKVAKVVIHPNYDGDFNNNIALIQIHGKISFGPAVKSVELPSAPPANGTEVTIASWRCTNVEDGTIPDKLQYINVTVIDNEECRSNGKTSICTIGPVGGDICLGVDGDPVVLNGVVFGLSFWFTWNPPSGKFDGHTNVALYINWIKKVTGS